MFLVSFGVIIAKGVEQFLFFDGIEGFAFSIERFNGLDDGLGHAVMSGFGAADYGKLLGSGDAFVPVFIIESETHKEGAPLCRLCLFFHFKNRLTTRRRISSFLTGATDVSKSLILTDVELSQAGEFEDCEEGRDNGVEAGAGFKEF